MEAMKERRSVQVTTKRAKKSKILESKERNGGVIQTETSV